MCTAATAYKFFLIIDILVRFDAHLADKQLAWAQMSMPATVYESYLKGLQVWTIFACACDR